MVRASTPAREGLTFYISLYIVCFWDFHLIQSLSIYFDLPTLPCLFTDPASFFYRPCLPFGCSLGILKSFNDIFDALSVQQLLI